MAKFIIEGGHALQGEIHPQGAKNEALQILCATLLTSERVVVHNVPNILDIRNLIDLMRDCGVEVEELPQAGDGPRPGPGSSAYTGSAYTGSTGADSHTRPGSGEVPGSTSADSHPGPGSSPYTGSTSADSHTRPGSGPSEGPSTGTRPGVGPNSDYPMARSYAFRAKAFNEEFLRSEEFLVRNAALRGSIMLIGPLLARLGEVTTSKPGGDKIGTRRVDTHFDGLRKLGAELTYRDGTYHLVASQLKGTYMLLDEASVTGTANIVMAAVLAQGTTTIYNAACEPYLQQLCKMLCRMGARISGIGSNLLTIEGVTQLHGTEHTLLPDMIEVGSFIGMAAMTRSALTIKNVSYKNLGIIPESFRRLGIQVIPQGDDLFIPAQQEYVIDTFLDGGVMTLADAPWPGLTPDLLSVLLVVATQCSGTVLIHQKMFESRLFFVDHLVGMGAQIILCDPHRAVVVGHNHRRELVGKEMRSPDIRAGIAMVIAALGARGTSVIHNIEQIDRGYQHIEDRLRALGAHITRH